MIFGKEELGGFLSICTIILVGLGFWATQDHKERKKEAVHKDQETQERIERAVAVKGRVIGLHDFSNSRIHAGDLTETILVCSGHGEEGTLTIVHAYTRGYNKPIEVTDGFVLEGEKCPNP